MSITKPGLSSHSGSELWCSMIGQPVLNVSKRLHLSKTMGTRTITQKDLKLKVNYSISFLSSKYKILTFWVCYIYSSVLQCFRLGSGAGSEFENKLVKTTGNKQLAHTTSSKLHNFPFFLHKLNEFSKTNLCRLEGTFFYITNLRDLRDHNPWVTHCFFEKQWTFHFAHMHSTTLL
jgi:hypothetical protein